MTERLLAIETASQGCSAALSAAGGILERYALAPRQHAGLILPMIESLLAEAGITVNQLDAIAFGRGPGSFTGVRIAAGIVQGVACGAGLPVVPVSTLAALALGGIRESGLDAAQVALDARRDEVYAAAYLLESDGRVALQGEECVCRPDSVVLPDARQRVAVGSGWEVYARALMQSAGERIVRVLPDFEPHAADVARLALPEFRAGRTVEAHLALPVYLRNEVADRPRESG